MISWNFIKCSLVLDLKHKSTAIVSVNSKDPTILKTFSRELLILRNFRRLNTNKICVRGIHSMGWTPYQLLHWKHNQLLLVVSNVRTLGFLKPQCQHFLYIVYKQHLEWINSLNVLKFSSIIIGILGFLKLKV